MTQSTHNHITHAQTHTVKIHAAYSKSVVKIHAAYSKSVVKIHAAYSKSVVLYILLVYQFYFITAKSLVEKKKYTTYVV